VSLQADIHWTQPFWALASADEFSYFVTIRRVGATVLVGAMGEIENVNHVFHPAGRLAASNSLFPYAETAVPSIPAVAPNSLSGCRDAIVQVTVRQKSASLNSERETVLDSTADRESSAQGWVMQRLRRTFAKYLAVFD
jgi:hypothetical protein